MRFFTDPTPFTHYGTLYGLPIYIKDPYGEGPDVAGKNIVTDWMLTWYPELMNSFQVLFYPYVQGFPICVKGRLTKKDMQ